MKTVSVTAERSYQILIDCNWLTHLPKDRALTVVLPKSLEEILGSDLGNFDPIFLPDSEAQKTITTLNSLLEELARRKVGRDGVLVAIGGGATTDLVGFAAAIYLRGIDWIAVPTTVAGMVDAAVGGKTGINLESGKNLVGAFHSPRSVLIDFKWLQTLSKRDINAGLVEALKCGFIADQKILSLFEGDIEKNLPEIVALSVGVKAKVVSEDFKESFQREILNYGHTLGHAIELDSNFQLRHGEAVAIGMNFAAELSYKYSGLNPEVVALHRTLLAKLSLPIRYRSSSWPNLYQHMLLDKKVRSNQIRFVLLNAVGNCSRGEDFSEEMLKQIYLEKIGE